MTGPRHLCIHGHFYQPPRENPWLESIELQDSAYPFHDWNARITAECYEPNAYARVIDEQGRLRRIVNTYERISFNFGPTLLAWMEAEAPDVYEAIIAADVSSRARFSGHGNALAQAYGHLIMPLATERDRVTQVRWGLRDFEHRFRRRPEGMWLPETAVDTASLEVLAAEGVRFTVLAPHQAARVRKKGGRTWADVSGGAVDPTQPYQVRLPSGATIDVFFYDGPVSQAVAFEGLLRSGEAFAGRLTDIFSDDRDHPQLAHIATDGETYGHHHRHGDMALAWALELIDERDDVALTNYGEYLERYPPDHVVELHEDTSWSCAHGVERWRSDCGCNAGTAESQAWRGPLRDALDWLRDELAAPFEERAGELLGDPWAARDAYIDVILDRSPAQIDRFLEAHGGGGLDESGRIQALKLLELQRHAMLMYTSCGWFFDELSGIETSQVLQYAGRTVQLAAELFGGEWEEPFLQLLEKAPSNRPDLANGRAVYERHVRPAMVNLTKLAAHYAASSVFESYGDRTRIYCYQAQRDDHRHLEAGRAQLGLGRVTLTSEITLEGGLVSYGVLHLGDHNLTAGVRLFLGMEEYRTMAQEVVEAFERADFPEVIRRLDQHFGTPHSIRTLFHDEQRRVLDQILDSSIEDAEDTLLRLHEDRAPLMRFLGDLGVPLPRPFRATAELVLNARLRQDFTDEECDIDEVRRLFEETATWGLQLDVAGLSFTLGGTIEDVAERLRDHPDDPVLLERLERLVVLARSLPWEVDLGRTQLAFYEALHRHHGEASRAADAGDTEAAAWLSHSGAVADLLAVTLPDR